MDDEDAEDDGEAAVAVTAGAGVVVMRVVATAAAAVEGENRVADALATLDSWSDCFHSSRVLPDHHRNFAIDVSDNVSSIFVSMIDVGSGVDEIRLMSSTISTRKKIEIANGTEIEIVIVIVIETETETETANVSANVMTND